MRRKLGGTWLGVWIIKHLITPLDRLLYRLTSGKLSTTGRPLAPMLLLTTVGRRSGKRRTTPVFYLRDAEHIILCNVNPGFERTNPWVLNLRASRSAEIRIGSDCYRCAARDATDAEVARYWPSLVDMWPAYQRHFARSGERSVFILDLVQKL